MTPPRIAVLDYGIGNLRSAEKALQHVGGDARLVSDPEEAAAARAVVLPGVGAFGRCAAALADSGLDRVALAVIEQGRPFLGICVGLQLLYEGSEEAPGVDGLGVLAGRVRALPAGVKRPQMQWNRLCRAVRCVHHGDGGAGGEPASGGSVIGTGLDAAGAASSRMLAGLPAEPWVYFVHSYAPPGGDEVVATCDYGGEVVAAVERGPLWGCQFHPEKSGVNGLAILANFVAAAGGR